MLKNSNFILSGVISFSFYILVCLFFINYVSQNKTKIHNFKNKTTIIELDMIVEKSDKKRIEKKAEKKREKLEDKFLIKETSKSNESTANIKSLFGKVKTKEKKVIKKKVNNVRKSLSVKRYKSKFEREKKSSNVKLDKLFNDSKTTRDTNLTSKTKIKNNESNKYFDEVNSLLYIWEPPVQVRDAGLSATVIIEITSSGEFSYIFSKFSQDYSFNDSLKAFLDEQKSIIYPKPQNSDLVRFEVKFTSEG